MLVDLLTTVVGLSVGWAIGGVIGWSLIRTDRSDPFNWRVFFSPVMYYKWLYK